MRPSEVEFWVLQVLDRVASRTTTEDSRIEFKSEWPKEPGRVARRLAGHANASRGEPVLWIIGVHESKGPIGATGCEVSTWWAQVRAQFDGIAPEMLINLDVHWKGIPVHAILFDTTRPPYTVVVSRANATGGITRETPWREGTAVRSANREDLLRMLVPATRLPILELLDASFVVSGQSWKLELTFYVTPTSDERIVIPVRSCQLRCKLDAWLFEPDDVQLYAPGEEDYLIRVTHSEAIILGPGKMFLHGGSIDVLGGSTLSTDLKGVKSRLNLTATVLPVGASLPITISALLNRHEHLTGPAGLQWRLAPDPFDAFAHDLSS